MKKNKLLSSALNHLTKALQDLEEDLEQRESAYDNKSEKWQESQQGEEFSENTQQLEFIKDEIENQITELEELLND